MLKRIQDVTMSLVMAQGRALFPPPHVAGLPGETFLVGRELSPRQTVTRSLRELDLDFRLSKKMIHAESMRRGGRDLAGSPVSQFVRHQHCSALSCSPRENPSGIKRTMLADFVVILAKDTNHTLLR